MLLPRCTHDSAGDRVINSVLGLSVRYLFGRSVAGPCVMVVFVFDKHPGMDRFDSVTITIDVNKQIIHSVCLIARVYVAV